MAAHRERVIGRESIIIEREAKQCHEKKEEERKRRGRKHKHTWSKGIVNTM